MLIARTHRMGKMTYSIVRLPGERPLPSCGSRRTRAAGPIPHLARVSVPSAVMSIPSLRHA